MLFTFTHKHYTEEMYDILREAGENPMPHELEVEIDGDSEGWCWSSDWKDTGYIFPSTSAAQQDAIDTLTREAEKRYWEYQSLGEIAVAVRATWGRVDAADAARKDAA